MSTVVDNRVVEMRFDNDNFERGVQQSLRSLDSLKKGLDMSESVKSIQELSSSTHSFNLDPLINAADIVTSRFSTMGIITATVISNLTSSAMSACKQIYNNIQSLIVQGGLTRAMNIENAKFQLKGLGVEWKNIQEDIAYAVDGTSYSLDAAAKVASQLVASQVNLGDEMKNSLRAISGVAAMTNSSYEEIGSIFTTIAGNGRLMSQQLLQLSTRGLNAAAVLGEALGKSEADIREMVTKGQIDFQTFAKAMDSAFGEHAKDANKTLNGTLANIRSAFAKIGAEFINPLIANEGVLVDLFNSVRERVNDIKNNISGSAEIFVSYASKISKSITKMLNESDISSLAVRIEDYFSALPPLLDGLGRILKNLGRIISPIGKAFRDIFPAKTRDELLEITTNFETLTKKIFVWSSTMNEIQRVFRGVFAIFDLGKQAITAFAEAIFPMFSGFGSISNGILKSAASLGDWIVEIDKTAKETDFFRNALKNVSEGIKEFNIKIDKFVDKLRELLIGIDSFGEAFGKVFNFIFGILKSAASILSSTFNVVINQLGKFVATLKTAGSAIGPFVKSLEQIFSNIAPSNIVDGGILGTVIIALYTMVRKFKSLKIEFKDIKSIFSNIFTPLKNLSGTTQTIKQALDNLRGALFAWQQDLKANMLLKLAVAVGILTISLSTLSTLDTDGLSRGLIAIGGLMTELVVGMAALQKVMSGNFTGTWKSFIMGFGQAEQLNVIGTVMLKLAASVLILVIAMKQLSQLNMEEIGKGLLSIAGLMAILVKSMQALSTDGKKNMTKGAGSMILLAVAVKILASAMNDISGISWEGIAKGLSSISVLLFALTKTVGSIDGKKLSGVGINILLVGTAMKILASAMNDISGISWEGIAKGLSSISVLLFALTKTVGSIDNSKMTSVGLGMVLVGASMKIMASAISDISNISWEGIAKGLSAIVVMMYSLTQSIGQIDNSKMVSIGLGMVLVGAAMKIMASAMSDIATLSWEGIAKGLSVYAIALVGLSKGLTAMTGSIGGAAALLVASTALLLLGTSLTVVSKLSWEGIAKGLIAIAGALAIIGGATAILSPLIPAMLALSGVIAIFGLGLLEISAAAMIFGAALATISTGFIAASTALAAGATELVLGIGIILLGIADLLPPLIEKIGEAAMVLVNTFIGLTPQLIEAGVTWMMEMLKGIQQVIPEIISTLTTLLLSVLSSIKTIAPEMVSTAISVLKDILTGILQIAPTVIETVLTIITDLLVAIAERTPDFVQAGCDIIFGFLQGVSQNLPKIIQAGCDIIIGFLSGVAKNLDDIIEQSILIIASFIEGIANGLPSIIQAGVDLICAFITGIADAYLQIVECAMETIITFIDGLATAIDENHQALYDASKHLVQSIINAISDFTTNSWSDITKLGKNLIEGFVEGMTSMVSDAVDTAKSFGNSVLDSIKDVLDIHSPSRALKEIAKYCVEGMVNGFLVYGGQALEAASDVADGIVDAFGNPLQIVADLIADDIDLNPVITPIVDVSGLKSSANIISEIFNKEPTLGISGITSDSINAISSYMQTNQNGSDNSDIVDAIGDLKKTLSNIKSNTYMINDVTYDDGSAVSNAIESLIDATIIEGRA